MPKTHEISFYSVKEFRDHATQVLRSPGPVMVTRHGKPAGLYIPLESESLTPELRDVVIEMIGQYAQARLKASGVTEEEILEDFESTRQPRR